MSQAVERVQPKRAPRREVFSPRQAAEFLGVSEGTMYRLLDSGQIPAVRVGGPGSRWLIGRARLTEWVNSGGSDRSSLPGETSGENSPDQPRAALRSQVKQGEAQTRRSA